jgi:hypothetical protein
VEVDDDGPGAGDGDAYGSAGGGRTCMVMLRTPGAEPGRGRPAQEAESRGDLVSRWTDGDRGSTPRSKPAEHCMAKEQTREWAKLEPDRSRDHAGGDR